ncbi:MAG: DUF3098 domain-containing protein [Bacteroidaceae bacterium]|nr:DUF3098 domain-containing protein [Bacteroidaceae bacterium]MBQ9175918.1 DUF3098 domain-containing protein [Bacteroidaceae bacterium]MBR1377795.1 DUF3098 domain-containing protein [Bacteroidaceae bacterium]
MSERNLAFGPINYIVLGIGLLIVVAGFILMAGDGSTESAFNPEIFSDLRIKVAPVTTLLGFIVVIAAILIKPHRHE